MTAALQELCRRGRIHTSHLYGIAVGGNSGSESMLHSVGMTTGSQLQNPVDVVCRWHRRSRRMVFEIFGTTKI